MTIMRPHNLRYLTRLYSTKPSAEVIHEPLAGTVAPHSLYLVLRTPKPIRTLESRPISPLRLDLQRSLLAHGGLVNLGHISDERAWARSERLCRTQLTSHGSEPEEDGFDDGFEEDQDEERYDAVVFAPDRPPLHLRGITPANVAEHADTTRLVQRDLPPLRRFAPGEYDGPVHIYVCTHGERDCRCGEHGSGLADALMAEVKRRRRESKGEGWDRVVVGEVAHVGGHKHAANALVFPHGEWLGELRAEHAPTLLDAIAARPFSNIEGETCPPLLPEHWRGRMGMNMEEQRTFISQYCSISTKCSRPPSVTCDSAASSNESCSGWSVTSDIEQFNPGTPPTAYAVSSWMTPYCKAPCESEIVATIINKLPVRAAGPPDC